jgi:uncharacterized membrane protein YdjX (TVP38/TMEM64 family)
MESPCKTEKTALTVGLSLLALLAGVTAFLALTGRLAAITSTLYGIFDSREHLRAYIESWGGWAPAAFISIQSLQVVLAPIPGELTGAVGGFIFGVLPSVLYSTVGLGVGSALAFLAARIIGLPLVRLAVSECMMEKFHFVIESRGTFIALLLFAIPGFPKDILCYLLGLSPMGFVTFVIVCTLGRIPGTVMLSYSGSAVYDQNWTLLVIVTVATFVTIGVFVLTREKIELWLRRKTGANAL